MNLPRWETNDTPKRLNEYDQERVDHVARMSLRAAAIAREVHEGITENPLPTRLVTEHLPRPWFRRPDSKIVAVYGDTPKAPTHLVGGRLYAGARWSVVLADAPPTVTLLRSDLEVAEETPEAVEAAMARAGAPDEVVERYLSMSAQLEALRAELADAFHLPLPAPGPTALHTAWMDRPWAFATAGSLACVAVYLGPGKMEALAGQVSTYDGWTIVLSEGRPYLLRESMRMLPAATDPASAAPAVGPPRSCRGCKFSGVDPDCEPFCTHPNVLATNAYGLVLTAAVRDHCGAELALFEPREPTGDETCR